MIDLPKVEPMTSPTSVGASLVCVVDDDAGVRQSLTAMLEAHGHAVTAFERGDRFLDAAERHRAACVLLDVRMPGPDGLEVLSRMRAEGSTAFVVMMTAHADVRLAVRAMKSGASDFVEKPIDAAATVTMVDRMLAAQARPAMAAAEHGVASGTLGTLTPREHEVAVRIASGLSNKEIARELAISPRTVEVHRARVMTKTGVRSVAHLVRLVLSAQPREPVS
jgi:two-component system response regulator FixJ